MSYVSLQKTKERSQLALLCLLMGAFVATMALMWIHPTGALLMLWLGMIAAAGGAVVVKLLAKAQQAAARKALRSDRCPRCGAGAYRGPPDENAWRCLDCGSVFLDSGDEQRPTASTS